jgi:subtilisin family serine protease
MKSLSVTTALLATGAAVFALSWSGGSPSTERGFMSRAEAIRGRPATPMSYAGVARRTTGRAVAYGAAAGVAAGVAVGAAAASTYPPGGCVQVVDAYGRVVTRCR